MASSVTAEELVRNPDALSGEAEDLIMLLESKGTGFEAIRKEYEQAYESLQKGLEGSINTERKVEETVAEINFTREQVSMIKRQIDESKASQDKSQSTLQALKAKRDTMKEEDEQMKKDIEILQAQIAEYKRALHRGANWTDEQLKERAKLQAQEESIGRNLSSRTQTLTHLRNEISALTTQIEELEKKKEVVEKENEETEGKIRENDQECKKIQSDKSSMENVLLDLQMESNLQKNTLGSLVTQSSTHKAVVLKIEAELHEAKQTMETYLTEYDALFRETQHLTETLEKQVGLNKMLKEENSVKSKSITTKKTEAKQVRKDLKKVEKLKDIAMQMMVDIEKEKQQHEIKRDELKAQINQLVMVEVKNKRKEIESQRVQIEEFKREKDILKKKLGSSEKNGHDIQEIIIFNENCMKVLQNEINGFQNSLRAQRDRIGNLLHDKEKHEKEAEEANRRYFTALEQLKLQDIQVRELQKQIMGSTSRLKQQQNLYEAVRSDRNLYSKSLMESQQEIDTMKSKFKIMNHQIEQLKEEIIAKDHALVKEHFNHHSVDKEKECLRNELTKIKKQIYSSEQMILNQRAEIQKLSQIIQEAEDERQRQQKEYESVSCERDILGGQLIKRNDELSTLYEKVRIQQSTLRHGEYRYQKCLDEMSAASKQYLKYQSERDEVMAKISSTNDLKQAVINLERDLLRERSKIRALSDEQETVLNVHRWRNLESSDPQRFEMINKIHGIQKRIIAKNQDIVEKELLIQEKEKLYVELKNILARQPGPEVEEQLNIYQENLRQKTKQLRSMDEELSMYKQQVEEFKCDIEGYQREIDGMKNSWITARRQAVAVARKVPGSSESGAVPPSDQPPQVEEGWEPALNIFAVDKSLAPATAPAAM